MLRGQTARFIQLALQLGNDPALLFNLSHEAVLHFLDMCELLNLRHLARLTEFCQLVAVTSDRRGLAPVAATADSLPLSVQLCEEIL